MRLSTGSLAPAEVVRLRFFRAGAAEPFGHGEHALGRVGAAVQDHVLAGLAQFRVDLVIDRELAGVDDAHVHAGLDRVVEEHRVHRLAHRLVAAEGERQVGDAARNMRVRQFRADFSRRLDEGDAVAVVLLDAGRDGENVGVEHDVFRRKAGLFGQELVGARADRDFALERVGLALLVEGHHHDRRAIGAHEARLAQKRLFAFLHRDRVDQALALKAFQARLDDGEFRRIDHRRHAGDVGLGGDEIEEFDHRPFGVDKALVHIDVDDLRAVGHLVAGDRERADISRRR